MALKHTAMRCFGQMAESSGLAALAVRKYGGVGAIFMLHSIVADNGVLPRENVQTSAAFLEKMIRHYQAQRVAMLSLSEAMAQLQSGSQRQFVSFTLDDGYRDNLTVALFKQLAETPEVGPPAGWRGRLKSLFSRRS